MAYSEFMYPGYSFERPIYLYIWEILVIFVFLVNVIVVLVLMRKRMRNSTNMILVAIAISDSLTGLVTLPTYIMVYREYEPAPSPAELAAMDQKMSSTRNSKTSPIVWSTKTPTTRTSDNNGSNFTDFANNTVNDDVQQTYSAQEGYALSEGLCVAFMLSKFFLSKFFHTISIYLTLFLGFQRYISVAYPFKAQTFFTIRNTVIVCAVIFVLSPVLHVYHLVDDKAVDGMCEWRLDNCEGDCAVLWITLIVRHLTPCALLTAFTVLFIKELRKCRLEMNREQSKRRSEENRRVTVIVISIFVVFLVPEIPYGFFLLSSVIAKHTKSLFDLKQNRAIHAAYEILLVLSFHANFYIYTMFNKRFRSGLKMMFVYPIRRALGHPVTWLPSSSHSSKSEPHRRTAGSRATAQTLLVNAHLDTTQMSTIERQCQVDAELVNGEKEIDD